MNIFKFNAKAHKLTQQDIERFTSIPQPRVSRLMNLSDKELPNKITLEEAFKISELFAQFEDRNMLEFLAEMINQTEIETQLKT